MKKFQSAAVLTVEPGSQNARLFRRVPRQSAVRWPHHRRTMALAIPANMAEDKTSGAWPAVERFWNEHAVKSGMVLFWAWYGIANWQAIGQLLHLV